MISKMTYEEKITSNDIYKRRLQYLLEQSFIEDARWISDDEFIIWIYYFNLDDFIAYIKDGFGTYPFDEGGFEDVVMFEDMIAINLCSFLQGYFTDHLSTIFPYKDYDWPN